jgi:hypothetical protein
MIHTSKKGRQKNPKRMRGDSDGGTGKGKLKKQRRKQEDAK